MESQGGQKHMKLTSEVTCWQQVSISHFWPVGLSTEWMVLWVILNVVRIVYFTDLHTQTEKHFGFPGYHWQNKSQCTHSFFTGCFYSEFATESQCMGDPYCPLAEKYNLLLDSNSFSLFSFVLREQNVAAQNSLGSFRCSLRAWKLLLFKNVLKHYWQWTLLFPLTCPELYQFSWCACI